MGDRPFNDNFGGGGSGGGRDFNRGSGGGLGGGNRGYNNGAIRVHCFCFTARTKQHSGLIGVLFIFRAQIEAPIAAATATLAMRVAEAAAPRATATLAAVPAVRRTVMAAVVTTTVATIATRAAPTDHQPIDHRQV